MADGLVIGSGMTVYRKRTALIGGGGAQWHGMSPGFSGTDPQ